MTRNLQIFHDTLLRLLRRGATKNIEKMIEKAHTADIGQAVRMMESLNDRQAVFGLIKNVQKKAEVLQVLDTQETINLIGNLDNPKIVEILHEMSSDSATDIIGSLPSEISDELLKLMEPRGSEKIEELLKYPQESAGGIMTTEFCALPKEITVGETVKKLQTDLELDNAFYAYVVDSAGLLVGVLSLRKLFQVKSDTPIETIMIADVISVRTDADQEEVAKLVARYNLLALPVVDENNKLVGIVTVDDVVDVIRDEATEDILKMGGVSDVDVLEQPSFKSARVRLPWLFVSLLGGLIAFKIMGRFESLLQSSIIVAYFIPLLMGMTGNVSIQTATVVVRGLATGRIRLNQIWLVLFKELKIGLLLGIAYGIIIGAFANIQYGHSFVYLGCAVGGAMTLSMMFSAVVGAGLPLVFERFNIDPALSTGPFVTTVVDVAGLLIFLNLATLLHGAL